MLELSSSSLLLSLFVLMRMVARLVKSTTEFRVQSAPQNFGSTKSERERKMVKLKIYIQYEDDSDESKNMKVKVVVPENKSLTCERIKVTLFLVLASYVRYYLYSLPMIYSFEQF